MSVSLTSIKLTILVIRPKIEPEYYVDSLVWIYVGEDLFRGKVQNLRVCPGKDSWM